MRKYLNTDTLIGFILLVVVFLAYWFLIRVSSVRKICAERTVSAIKSEEHVDWLKWSDKYYDICLHEHGVN
jgi:hypothetical protein